MVPSFYTYVPWNWHFCSFSSYRDWSRRNKIYCALNKERGEQFSSCVINGWGFVERYRSVQWWELKNSWKELCSTLNCISRWISALYFAHWKWMEVKFVESWVCCDNAVFFFICSRQIVMLEYFDERFQGFVTPDEFIRVDGWEIVLWRYFDKAINILQLNNDGAIVTCSVILFKCVWRWLPWIFWNKRNVMYFLDTLEI